MKLLETVQARQNEDWLLAPNRDRFNRLLHKYCADLKQYPSNSKILLIDTDPIHFLAKFSAAVSANYPIFLCNPHWQVREWQQVFDLVQPNLIWGNLPPSSSHLTPADELENIPPATRIMIPTGGSSGRIKFTLHSWRSLSASVTGFYQYFAQKPVNSFCVLPLYHVSGLMQFLRSLLTGGRIQIMPYSELKQGNLGISKPNHFYISLVPTQLQFLLDVYPQWLSQFQMVLLGGAPLWKELRDRARQCTIKLAPTYGLTETASQVATLKPAEFLKGNESSGRVLPHARIEILDDRATKLEANRIGRIHIYAHSACQGYYSPRGDRFLKTVIPTEDLGYLDDRGYLYVIGRGDRQIITGGENISPVEIEGVILETKLVRDVCVVGIPDETWGEAIAAIFVSKENYSERDIQGRLTGKLSHFKHPKYWLPVSELPRCDRGKINYPRVRELLTQFAESQKRDRQSNRQNNQF